jgi:hypothetical protein
MADKENALAALGGGGDFSRIFDGRGNRLFEEDVLACFERGDGRLGVQMETASISGSASRS